MECSSGIIQKLQFEVNTSIEIKKKCNSYIRQCRHTCYLKNTPLDVIIVGWSR